MSRAVLTPFDRSAAIAQGRYLRKRVLPVGTIDYKGRPLNFTRSYNDSLARAFAERAYDQVPFQLADSGNTHTNDPERYRGQIVRFDSDGDGLWAVLDPTDAGRRIIMENPDLGVSARIVEDYARADGRYFPQAIQHVLGTLDPRIPGLGGWQAIEAANSGDVSVTLDLTGESFTGKQEDGKMPDLTPEQQARLSRLLEIPEDQFNAVIGGLTAPALSDDELNALTGEGGTEGELSDAELEELLSAAAELDAAGMLEDAPVGAGAGAALAGDPRYDMALELAHARNDENERQIGVINAELDRQRFDAEKLRLVNDCGVPPYLVDLAQPLLEGTGHVVELATPTAGGQTRVDAGQITRRLLTEFGKMSGALDLSLETGSALDEPAQNQAGQQARTDLVGRFRAQTGL